MFKKTIWRPDTCDCQIEYEWDDQIDENSRVHTGSKILEACFAHRRVTEFKEIFIILTNENSRKNKLLGEILNNIPSAVQEISQPDGSKIRQLKAGIEYKWNFDKDRNLIVNLKGITDAQKNLIKTLALNRFGTKVNIL